MHKNQTGITLLETLLTIAILFIVGVLIWSTYHQGIKFSNQAISKNQIQQEANLVITNLTMIHQTSTEYTIESDNSCTFTIVATKKTGTEVYKAENSSLCLKASYSDPVRVDPLTTNNIFPINLTISDKNDSSNYIVVEIILSRLKNY